MNTDSRSIDIVIPCYNYARFLKRSVESVLSQERVNVRVLIIDDCSTDDTPAVGAELARDPRVEFRRHAKNMRHIATYNEGLIGWASSKYSLLLSADDWLAPGALARSIDVLEAHPEVTFVFGYALVVTQPVPPEAMPKLDGKYCVLTGAQYTDECIASANPVSTPTAVVRTELQKKVGGYRPELPHSGDMEMWLKFAALGSVAIVRDVQAFYGWHGANMSRDTYRALLGDLREQEAACLEPLAMWPDADRQRWTTMLRRRLGNNAFWAAHRAFGAGDTAGARECFEYAKQQDDTLVPSMRHLTFMAKRAIGARAWNALKPLADSLRGVSHPKAGDHFNVGRLTGWGPPDESLWRAPMRSA